MAVGFVAGSRSTLTDTTSQKRQVDDLLDVMSPDEVPILKMIGIDGEAGTNPKLEWVMDELLAIEDTIHSAVSDTTGTSVVVHNGPAFQIGNVIMIDDEYMWVTGVTTNTLTVTRGFAGTTAATHSADAAVTIIGMAELENTDAPQKSTTTFDFPYNYFQIFDQYYQISHRQQNTAAYGLSNDDDYQLSKAFKEVAIKLEMAAIYGKKQAPTATLPGLMGGFDEFIASHSTSLSDAALTEKDIEDLLQTIYYDVGPENMAKTIVCGAWVKRKINSFFSPNAQMPRESRVGGVVVNTIDTDFGKIDVLMHLRAPKDKLYIINPSFLSIHPYKDSKFFDQELAKSGAYIKRQIYGDYTLKVRNESAMGKLTDISLTS